MVVSSELGRGGGGLLIGGLLIGPLHLLHVLLHTRLKVRSADEEADVVASAQSSRAEQLSLQPLYARPPPIWLHPTFAAEFADPFIADTPFEESAMHVSLEVRGVGIA